MRTFFKWNKRKIGTFFGLILVLLVFLIYQNSVTQSVGPYIPRPRLRTRNMIHNHISSFNKMLVAYYTRASGVITDSRSKIFSENLNQICAMLDPEDYQSADSIIVSLVDLVRFPPASSEGLSYRTMHPSQLWLILTEESPRNSYRSVEMKNITELDDWFNLTATLKPESDFHIQYRGYRIKPAIVDLLRDKFNVTLNNRTVQSKSDVSLNYSSSYLQTLASVLEIELINRQLAQSRECPHECNQPLPSHLVTALQPYLPPIISHTINRKTVFIAWFVSNCNSHSRREDYVYQLRSQPNIRVDIFGDCSSIYHSPIQSIQCRKGTGGDCKEKILAFYRFYLSFENSKCDSYITEKYWMQGLNGQAIPIVLGARKKEYARIGVPNSYIHVDDFQNPADLARELRRLNGNDTEYQKYLQWTQLYDIGEAYSPSARTDIPSTLCLLGHYQRLHAMNDRPEQLLRKIRDIFDVAKMRLPNFNWTTATTRLVRMSQFYSTTVNCWDSPYPSLFKQIWNYLFTWRNFFF